MATVLDHGRIILHWGPANELELSNPFSPKRAYVPQVCNTHPLLRTLNYLTLSLTSLIQWLSTSLSTKQTISVRLMGIWSSSTPHSLGVFRKSTVQSRPRDAKCYQKCPGIFSTPVAPRGSSPQFIFSRWRQRFDLLFVNSYHLELASSRPVSKQTKPNKTKTINQHG